MRRLELGVGLGLVLLACNGSITGAPTGIGGMSATFGFGGDEGTAVTPWSTSSRSKEASTSAFTTGFTTGTAVTAGCTIICDSPTTGECYEDCGGFGSSSSSSGYIGASSSSSGVIVTTTTINPVTYSTLPTGTATGESTSSSGTILTTTPVTDCGCPGGTLCVHPCNCAGLAFPYCVALEGDSLPNGVQSCVITETIVGLTGDCYETCPPCGVIIAGSGGAGGALGYGGSAGAAGAMPSSSSSK